MSLFKTDKDTKDLKREITAMIDRGRPLVKNGKKYYGRKAKEQLPSLAGDSVFSILAQIWEDMTR